MTNYNQKIGAYLAKERKAKKISQTQLAQRLGVSKTAVHYWETGKRTIYADQMQPLLKEPGKYLFGGDIGLSRDIIQSERVEAIKKAGVKPIRLHDFRHSHATWLFNNGVNILAISRRLGHKDLNTTLRIYTHLLESSDNEMMAKINAFKSR